MTPQQKLERLIAIAKEAKSIVDSMDSLDPMRVAGITVSLDAPHAKMWMTDEKDFIILHDEYIETELPKDARFTHELYSASSGVEIFCYKGWKGVRS